MVTPKCILWAGTKSKSSEILCHVWLSTWLTWNKWALPGTMSEIGGFSTQGQVTLSQIVQYGRNANLPKIFCLLLVISKFYQISDFNKEWSCHAWDTFTPLLDSWDIFRHTRAYNYKVNEPTLPRFKLLWDTYKFEESLVKIEGAVPGQHFLHCKQCTFWFPDRALFWTDLHQF